MYRGGPLGFNDPVSAAGRAIGKPTDAMVADALPSFVEGFVLVGRKLAGLDLHKGLLSSKNINWPSARRTRPGNEAHERAARLELERSYPEWKDSVRNTRSVAYQRKNKAAARRQSAVAAAAAAGANSGSQGMLAMAVDDSDLSGHSSSEDEREDDDEQPSTGSAGSGGGAAVAVIESKMAAGAPADAEVAAETDEDEERGVLMVPPLPAPTEAQKMFELEAKTKGDLFYDTHKMIGQLRTMHRALMAQRLAFPTDALFFRWWRTHGNGYRQGTDEHGRSDGTGAAGPQPAYMWPLEEGWTAPPRAVSACIKSLCDSVVLDAHGPDAEQATNLCTASLLDDLLDASVLYMASQLAAEREANKTDAERAQEAAELAAQRDARESALVDAALREGVAATVAAEVDASVEEVLQEEAAASAAREAAEKDAAVAAAAGGEEKEKHAASEDGAASENAATADAAAQDTEQAKEEPTGASDEPDDDLKHAATWSSAAHGFRHRITTARVNESKSGGFKGKPHERLRRSSTSAVRRSMSARISEGKISSSKSSSPPSSSSASASASSPTRRPRQRVRRSTMAHHVSESKRAGGHSHSHTPSK